SNDVKTFTTRDSDSPTTINCFCLHKLCSAVSDSRIALPARAGKFVTLHAKVTLTSAGALLTLGSGKNCEINWRDSWAECPEGDDDPDICPVDDVRAGSRSCGRAAIAAAASARRFADGAGQ